jgi:phenylalanine-4-hydroxylase
MAERNAKGRAGTVRLENASQTTSGFANRAPQVHIAEYLDALPAQDYAAYSADAHAVWSEVLARSEQVVTRHAERIHPQYIEGLRALQLPTHVPRTDELNERLRGTGWTIVAVDGYLPATTYASLMAENIFPVSSRIRRREHIDFAPEPDMVHDILGHLPMLFCGEHRDYLHELAVHASRATPNALDTAYHEAVRQMGELKSALGGEPDALASAEATVEQVYGELVSNASEVTCLRRMYIWSIEFGLFGTRDDFIVHGAALMSAPTELSRVLSGSARLEPYSRAVIEHENSFSDLLERYFVAKDYGHLHEVLSAYATSMHQSIIPGTSEVRELRPQAFDLVRRSNA